MTQTMKSVSIALLAIFAAAFMFTATNTLVSAEHDEYKKVDICYWSKYKQSWRFKEEVKEKDLGEYPGYFLYTREKGDDLREDAWCVAQRTATPAEVVFVDPTCDEDGSYTIPEVDGVVYLVNDEVVVAGTYPMEDGDSVKVTTEAADMWWLEDESTTEWTHEFVNEEVCETPVVEEEEEEPQVLAVATPQVTQTPTGSANAGGAGQIALFGLAASIAVAAFGAVARKFSRN